MILTARLGKEVLFTAALAAWCVLEMFQIFQIFSLIDQQHCEFLDQCDGEMCDGI